MGLGSVQSASLYGSSRASGSRNRASSHEVKGEESKFPKAETLSAFERLTKVPNLRTFLK